MTETVTKAPTMGSTIDNLWTLREEKRELDAKSKAIGVKIEALEKVLLTVMDSQDTDKGAGRKGSVSIGESIHPNTVEWKDFMRFVAAGKRGDKEAYLHLVQKRVAVEAYREVLSLGIVVPGITPFTKRVINLRSL